MIRNRLFYVSLIGCVSLSACTTTQEARTTICNNKAKIIAAAQKTIQATEALCPLELEALENAPN